MVVSSGDDRLDATDQELGTVRTRVVAAIRQQWQIRDLQVSKTHNLQVSRKRLDQNDVQPKAAGNEIENLKYEVKIVTPVSEVACMDHSIKRTFATLSERARDFALGDIARLSRLRWAYERLCPLASVSTHETLPQISHFYHVYADGAWRNPCVQHVSALRESGLAAELKTFHIGIAGAPSNRRDVRRFFTETAIPHQICAEADAGWEQVTQTELRQYAITDATCVSNNAVLYAHTKGAANVSQLNEGWRAAMTKHVVWGWRRALSHLAHFDAAGCYWTGNFFAGTYWWARVSYLANLPPVGLEDRFDAERWIGQTTDPRMYDLRSPVTGILNPDSQLVLIRSDSAAEHQNGSVV